MLLFFLSNAFALLPDPPIDNMTSLNSVAIASLQGNFLSSLSKSLPTTNNPIEAADARLIKLDPSVDNFISDKKPPKILWVWAENHADEVNEAADLQSCTDGINLKFKSKTLSSLLSVSFIGVNKNITDPTQLGLDLPFSSEELSSARPHDNLTVSLSGEFNFLYDRTVLHYRYLPCSETGSEGICVPSCDLYDISSDVVSFSIPFSSNLSYEVEGGNVLFFLSSPVLREQWYLNNKFNNIVFSNRVFYKSSANVNGEDIGNATAYLFNFHNDNFGIYYIESIKSVNTSNNPRMEFKEDSVLVSPTQIELNNDSFSYIYQINSTYNGIGKNNASLVLVDRFSNTFEIKEEITSRFLSFNGNINENVRADQDPVNRPSLLKKEDKIQNIIITIGAIGVFLFIVLKKSF